MSAMMGRHQRAVMMTLALLIALLSFANAAVAQLQHTSIRRSTDLRSHIEEQTAVIEVKNIGSTAISDYVYIVPSAKAAHLALVEASQSDKKLEVTETTAAALPASTTAAAAAADLQSAAIFTIAFPSPLPAGNSITFTILSVYTHTVAPYPTHIEQGERQLVLYDDSAVFYSPYGTTTQTATFKLASTRIESYTKRVSGAAAKVSGADVTYEAIDNIAPYTSAASSSSSSNNNVKLHFENNNAFITFSSEVKEVEVSHWGNVAVEENFILTHSGAALKNGFNRADYEQRPPSNSIPGSFRSLHATLPSRAHSLYYTDRIGNVSTSHVHYSRRAAAAAAGVAVELQARYPMFGGWRTDVRFGYSLPSVGSLYTDATDHSRFVLNLTFASCFAAAAVDAYEVRVVLPEGVTDIEWSTPFSVDAAAADTKQTYLDTTGRPVLVLQKSNVVNKRHAQHFQVRYKYTAAALLWEPLLLVSIFAAFFAAAMVYSRIDVSITPAVGVAKRVTAATTTTTAAAATAAAAAAGSGHRSLQSNRGGLIGEAVDSVIAQTFDIVDACLDKQAAAAAVDSSVSSVQRLLLDPIGQEPQLKELARELYLLIATLQTTAQQYALLTEADSYVQQAKAKHELQERATLIEGVLQQMAYE